MLRVYEPGQNFPGPYRWITTCRFLDSETVEVVGTVKPPTVADWRAVLGALGAMGVTEVRYKTYKKGELRTRRRLLGAKK